MCPSVEVYYGVLQVRYLQAAAQLLFVYPFVIDIPVCIITKTVIIIIFNSYCMF